MNDEQRKAIQDCIDAGNTATQGKWAVPLPEYPNCVYAGHEGSTLITAVRGLSTKNVNDVFNATFIAAAANSRDALKAMVAENAALREALAELATMDSGFPLDLTETLSTLEGREEISDSMTTHEIIARKALEATNDQ